MARGAATTKSTVGRGPHVVWVTRTSPSLETTAVQVRAMGFEVVVEPLLAVRARMDGAPHRSEGRQRPRLHQRQRRARLRRAFVRAGAPGIRRRRFHRHGGAAGRARFKSVLSAQGDVSALAAALSARRRELPGVILQPGAAETAGDLGGALEAVGLKLRQTTLYETVEVEPSAALVELLPGIDHVLLYSPKAARALAKLVKPHPAPHLTALTLSRQIARPLSRAGLCRRSAWPRRPNETCADRPATSIAGRVRPESNCARPAAHGALVKGDEAPRLILLNWRRPATWRRTGAGHCAPSASLPGLPCACCACSPAGPWGGWASRSPRRRSRSRPRPRRRAHRAWRPARLWPPLAAPSACRGHRRADPPM